MFPVLSNDFWPSWKAEDDVEAAAVYEFDSPDIEASFSSFVSCVESLSDFSSFTERGWEGAICCKKEKEKREK